MFPASRKQEHFLMNITRHRNVSARSFKHQLMSSSPVVFFGVFKRALFELLVHLPVEVVPQEERPEPEQSVHLLRLADPQPFPL